MRVRHRGNKSEQRLNDGDASLAARCRSNRNEVEFAVFLIGGAIERANSIAKSHSVALLTQIYSSTVQLFWIYKQLYCRDIYMYSIYCTIFSRIMPNLTNYYRSTSNVGRSYQNPLIRNIVTEKLVKQLCWKKM